MVNLTDQEICLNLKRLYNETETSVKANAIVSRAYMEKTSVETINEKVNAQMNSIKAAIYGINPKFKEGSKNYDATKKLVAESLAAYEAALIDLSKFYDGKIEQLILRKVELEANLIGSILNQEYLSEDIIDKSYQKDNDKAKVSVSDNIKSVIERFKSKKAAHTEIVPLEISRLADKLDVVGEIEQQFSSKIEKRESERKENMEFSGKVEKEISMINSEIERINEQKKKSIYDAMEVGDKAMVSTLKKPRVIKKITRFFVSRFNTAKVVESSIIVPLNERIENFKTNELSSIKG